MLDYDHFQYLPFSFFKFNDDFCPANGIRIVNMAVTVLGDSYSVKSHVRCVSLDSTGNVTLAWEPTLDTNAVPSFCGIYH